MFFTVLICVFVTSYLFFAAGLYFFQYFVEVVLGKSVQYQKLTRVSLGVSILTVKLWFADCLFPLITGLPVIGQSPCTAHEALKQLIEKLLKEAVNLPLLEQARIHPVNVPEDTTNKTYEDLLATAIINKVNDD